MLDLIAFPEHSRIWIYGSDQELPVDRIFDIHDQIQDFISHWHSHQIGLVATGGILHNYFVILVVDESKNPPGGCSIDKSVHFIQNLGQQYSVNFFNRSIFHYLDSDRVMTVPLSLLPEYYEEGRIKNSTLFFNNLVNTKSDFINNWIQPLEKSWHFRFCHKELIQ